MAARQGPSRAECERLKVYGQRAKADPNHGPNYGLHQPR
jgi:hypothetical protein